MTRARDFQLRAGSVAQRLIEFLDAATPGTRLSRDDIAARFDTLRPNVTTLLAKSVDNGLLAFTSEGRTRYYHLPLPAEEAEPEKAGPLERMRFYEDGDLAFAGCTIDEEGNVLLKAAQLEQILKFVSRAPVDHVTGARAEPQP